LLPALAAALTIAGYAAHSVDVAWVSSVFLGFFDSASYTNAYVLPTELPQIGRKYAPVAIGLMNSMGILGGSVASTLFAFLVLTSGYSVSWLILAVMVCVFLPFVYLAREPYFLLQSKDTTSNTPNNLVKADASFKPLFMRRGEENDSLSVTKER